MQLLSPLRTPSLPSNQGEASIADSVTPIVSKDGAMRSALAILDQALVSGTNFTAAVLIGRLCGAGEFGAYTLSFTLLILISAAHEALVLSPYTVYAARFTGQRLRGYGGSTLLQCFVIAMTVSLILMVCGIGLTRFELIAQGNFAFVLAVVSPFTLLREFARRWSFAHLQPGEATAIDGTTAAVQLIGLGLLWFAGKLSAISALIVIGVACGMAGLIWLWLRRREFQFRCRRIVANACRNLRFGRWMLPARMTAVVQGHSLSWLVACLLGLTAAGWFAACSTLIAAFNPVLMGIGSLLAPQTAHAYSSGGSQQLRSVVWRATLLVTIATSGFAIIAAAFGSELLVLVFGSQYAPFGGVVTLLALALLASILGMGADNGLRAIERPDAGFAASLTGLVISIAASLVLVPQWGLAGAATGLLIGSLCSSAVYCTTFTRILRGLS